MNLDKNFQELNEEFKNDISHIAVKHKLISRTAAEIKMRPIDWLWPKRFAKGKLSIIAGEPGLGKSQVTVYLAANITLGRDFPDGEKCPQGNVIFLSAEDDPEDTIVPRLKAAGADCSKVHIVDAIKATVNTQDSMLQFSLSTDLNVLEEKIKAIGNVVAIFIDPISSYLGNKIDEHKNAAVRSTLAPLSKLAEKYKIAVICVTHLNKCENQKAMHRVVGSIGFIAASRSAFAVIRDENEDKKRLFLPIKNNLGNDSTGLSFFIEEQIIEQEITTSKIAWTKEVITEKADVIMDGYSDQRSVIEDAKTFLQDLLFEAPMHVKEIFQQAKEEDLSVKNLRRAGKSLGIKISRRGFGPGGKTYWELPNGSAA